MVCDGQGRSGSGRKSLEPPVRSRNCAIRILDRQSNMNPILELLPEWAWVVISIALLFALFMLSLRFVIETAIEKALGAKLKQINDSVNELQHIRDDLKMLRKLNKLDELDTLKQLEKLDALDVLRQLEWWKSGKDPTLASRLLDELKLSSKITGSFANELFNRIKVLIT